VQPAFHHLHEAGLVEIPPFVDRDVVALPELRRTVEAGLEL
jgi:hypothetical protein